MGSRALIGALGLAVSGTSIKLPPVGWSTRFQRKQTREGFATLRFEIFTCGAILGRGGHHLVLLCPKTRGGYSERKPLFNNLLHWPPSTSPKFTPPIRNAA